jgi:hypothetical protein
MTPYNDPAVAISISMAEKDETLFEDSFDALYKANLQNASRQELCLVLGMAVGTMVRLRARIKELEQQLNGTRN